MFLCLIGASVAQLSLSRTHNRRLATIQPYPGGEAVNSTPQTFPPTGDVGSVDFVEQVWWATKSAVALLPFLCSTRRVARRHCSRRVDVDVPSHCATRYYRVTRRLM
jgi:hypothetical protein